MLAIRRYILLIILGLAVIHAFHTFHLSSLLHGGRDSGDIISQRSSSSASQRIHFDHHHRRRNSDDDDNDEGGGNTQKQNGKKNIDLPPVTISAPDGDDDDRNSPSPASSAALLLASSWNSVEEILDSVSKLPHLRPQEKDRHIRWIPRVNGAVSIEEDSVGAALGGAADIGANYKKYNSGADLLGGAQTCFWQWDVITTSAASSSAKKRKRQQKSRKSADNNENMLRPDLAQDRDAQQGKEKQQEEEGQRGRQKSRYVNRNTFTFCATSAADPLLAEVAALGVTNAIRQDLITEFSESDRNGGPPSGGGGGGNAFLASAEGFLADIDFKFEFGHDHHRRHGRRQHQPENAAEESGLCDFTLKPLSGVPAVFGGGGGGEKKNNNNDKKNAVDEETVVRTAADMVEDETYSLFVASRRTVIVEANSVQGVHHALRTFFLHFKENGFVLERKVSGKSSLFSMPCLRVVKDSPALSWRSQHVDVARHFFSPDFIINRVLRPMAWSKMNVLHLHLSDDQGWRVESSVFPALHAFGGRRQPNLNGMASQKFVKSRGYVKRAKFWSLEDIWRVVNAARARGIRVMPEIDVPAHAAALLLGLEAELERFDYLLPATSSSSSSSSSLEKQKQQQEEEEKLIASILKERLRKRLSRSKSLKEMSRHNLFSSSSSSTSSDHRQHHAAEKKNGDSSKDDTAGGDSSSEPTTTGATTPTSHIRTWIEQTAIPRAAKAIRHAVFNVLRNETSFSLLESKMRSVVFDNGFPWRRSVWGLFHHGNGDCSVPEHLNKKKNAHNKKYHHHRHHQQGDDAPPRQQQQGKTTSDDDDDDLELDKRKFFKNTDWSNEDALESILTDTDNEFAQSFIASHSAVNCMGGTHAIVDPSDDAAAILSLVLAEVSFSFHTPLDYSSSGAAFSSSSSSFDHDDETRRRKQQQPSEKNQEEDESLVGNPMAEHGEGIDQSLLLFEEGLSSSKGVVVFRSSTFGPVALFHVGGDQAEFLRNFAYEPWSRVLGAAAAAASRGNIGGGGGAVVVQGDEENDADIRDNKRRKKNRKNKKKNFSGGGGVSGPEQKSNSQMSDEEERELVSAFPVLLLGSSSSSSSSSSSLLLSEQDHHLQLALTSHLIHQLRAASGHWDTRSAVWDETLLLLDGLPPPGTVIVLWRDDGVIWKEVSAMIRMQRRRMFNKKQQSSSSSAAATRLLLQPSYLSQAEGEEDFPVVFAGKTRLYFDYAQHAGGAAKNHFWPLNTFGSWIPFRSSSLERVFLVPDLFPPQLLPSACTPADEFAAELEQQQQQRASSAKAIGGSSSSFQQHHPGFSSTKRKTKRRYNPRQGFISPDTLPGIAIIGIGGHLWSELLITEEIFQYQLFPRMFGVAEAAWAFCLSGIVPSVQHVLPARDHQHHQQNRQAHHHDNYDEQGGGGAGGGGERCSVQSLLQLPETNRAVVYQKSGGGGGGGQQGRSRRRQQQRHEQEEILSDEEANALPALQPRCLRHQIVGAPIMRSCVKTNSNDNNKNKKISSAGVGGANNAKHEVAPIFSLWETKLMCSSQYDEAMLHFS